MLQKGLHVFCCVFYRTFTVADRDLQTEEGPARLSRWGGGGGGGGGGLEGLKKIFSLV